MSFQSNILNFPARPVSAYMDDLVARAARFQTLRRPKILVDAARAGLPMWRRERDLGRLLGRDRLPGQGAALAQLLTEEGAMNDARLAGEATYDPHRHILLATAILAERRGAA